MNHFKLLSAALIAGVFTITACEKGSSEDSETIITGDGAIKTPNGKSCLLTSIDYDGDKATIEYNAKGKISKIIFVEEGETDEYITNYTYEDNKIIFTEYEDGVLESTETFNLVNGLVSTSTSSYEENRGDSYTYTRTRNTSYEHNAEGYLTKATATYTTLSNAPNFETEVETNVLTYTYEKGNLISETEVYARDEYSYSYVRNYEYYADKTNTVTDEDMFFLTKASKNLVKKFTETTSNNNNEVSNTYTSSFTYEINTDGLVKKSTEVDGESNAEITTYQYNCK